MAGKPIREVTGNRAPIVTGSSGRRPGATRTGGSVKTARQRGGWELAENSLVTGRETPQMPKPEMGGYLGYSRLGHRRQQRSPHEMGCAAALGTCVAPIPSCS